MTQNAARDRRRQRYYRYAVSIQKEDPASPHFFYQNRETSLYKTVTRLDKNYTVLNLSKLNHTVEYISKKSTHGRQNHYMENTDTVQHEQISTQLSYKWLEDGQLFLEGFSLAVQDQVIATQNYQLIQLNTELCHRDL